MDKVWVKHYDKGVPRDPRLSADHPAPAAGGHRQALSPDSTAIIFPGALGDALRLSYRQLDDDANRMANALAGMGVQQGRPGGAAHAQLPAVRDRLLCGAQAGRHRGGLQSPVLSAGDRAPAQRLRGQGHHSAQPLLPERGRGQSPGRSCEHVIVAYIKEYLPPVSRLLFSLLKEKKEGHRPRMDRDQGIHFFQDLLKGNQPQAARRLTSARRTSPCFSTPGGPPA